MTTICFVRHGETDWNVQGKLQGKTDIPLNNNGIAQAEESATFLMNESWDLVIASPLKRAKNTAEIINEKLNLPLILNDAFMERSFGDAEGMLLTERMAAYPNHDYPNQEARESFENRLIKGMTEIANEYQDKRVLLVAHGAVINAILSVISEGEIGSGKTSLHNACRSTLTFDSRKWTIESYNQVDHLTSAKANTALIL